MNHPPDSDRPNFFGCAMLLVAFGWAFAAVVASSAWAWWLLRG